MWFNQVGDKVSLEYYQVRPKSDPCTEILTQTQNSCNEMLTWVTNTFN